MTIKQLKNNLENVTRQTAKQWQDDPEKTMFFIDVARMFDEADDISTWDSNFETLRRIFEAHMEKLLN